MPLEKALLFHRKQQVKLQLFKQQAANLPTPQGIYPRPAKPAGRSLELLVERNHVSPDSLSVPQIATSRPNVTLPPPLKTPCHSIFKPPRMNPYEVLLRDREEI